MAVKRTRLYGLQGIPRPDFNLVIKGWLDCELNLREHSRPAAFEGVREAYVSAVTAAMEGGLSLRDAHRAALSGLTAMLFGHDLAAELRGRLSGDTVNPAGFRTTLSQGVAKNVGENFVNV